MIQLLKYARFAKNLDIDVREVVEHINDEDQDFEVDGYRFIQEDGIDEVMEEQLGSDDYMLGCATSHFLADVLGIDEDVITAMQEAEAFEAIGKLVLSMGKLSEYQATMVTWDGYGHYFSSYDGSEESCGDYYVFRVG